MSGDAILDKLTDLNNVATEVWKEAYETFCKSPTHRNEYARGGASTYRDMLGRAWLKYRSEMDIEAARNDIQSILKSADKWTAEFTEWSRDLDAEKFGAARDIHQAAAERIRKAYLDISNVKNEPADVRYPAAASLILLIGSTGERILSVEGETQYYIGHDSKQPNWVDDGLFDQVWDKALLAARPLVPTIRNSEGKYDEEFQTEISEYISKLGAEEMTKPMFEEPYPDSHGITTFYSYQIQTIVPMAVGAPITFYGRGSESKLIHVAANNATIMPTNV